MLWDTRSSKKSQTKQAFPKAGYCYDVIEREGAKDVKVYETRPREKKRRIANVPTMELGILTAEWAWGQEMQRLRREGEVAVSAQERGADPGVRYLLEVSESQYLTAQATLPSVFGLPVGMRMIQEDNNDGWTTDLLPEDKLNRAVIQVNEDLTRRGETPKLAVPHPARRTPPETVKELTVFLQQHFVWEEGLMVVTTWPDAGLQWGDLAEKHPGLMERRGRASPKPEQTTPANA